MGKFRKYIAVSVLACILSPAIPLHLIAQTEGTGGAGAQAADSATGAGVSAGQAAAAGILAGTIALGVAVVAGGTSATIPVFTGGETTVTHHSTATPH